MPDDPRFDIIMEQLREMREDIKALHTPANCPYEPRLRKLEIALAFWKGGLAALAALAGLVGGAVATLITSWISGRRL